MKCKHCDLPMFEYKLTHNGVPATSYVCIMKHLRLKPGAKPKFGIKKTFQGIFGAI